MTGVKLTCAVFLLLTFLVNVCAHESSHGEHASLDHQHHHHDLRLEAEKQTKCHERHPPRGKEENAESKGTPLKLQAEILEERSYYGHQHDHDHQRDDGSLSAKGLWFQAMGSSLLVSSASLVSLSILPFIVSNGKPPKGLVDALASFGAGSMLGDAFLHQLPHAFGRSAHSHGAQHANQLADGAGNGGEHSHGHSLEDLTVGLAVLGGILLFFLIEKIVRLTEELSVGPSLRHNHLRHKLKKEESYSEVKEGAQVDHRDDDDHNSNLGLRKRPGKIEGEGESIGGNINDKARFSKLQATSKRNNGSVNEVRVDQAKGSSKLVLGYLNLFSDDVHNFTDGMALGSAFLLHGTVGGWSRTLFLLAHELPQEIGDFGILVSSGFGVWKALVFNFLSALVSLAGTALALWMGGSTINSSVIEGFTAGGFIYIAVGSVIPDMHSEGSSIKTSVIQFCSLIVGIGIAVAISLAE
ncbi:hypothetical protein R1flu_018989 [Riccia fluitans]|uniref:IAA-alanine resistance protein 1 n=1 Tax=Riccia fluitans TaxID=41844 RepID=A0ABD1ZIY2_9MARC